MCRSKLASTPSQQKWHADSDMLLPSLGSTFALEDSTAMTQFALPSKHPRPCLFKSAKAYAAHMNPLWESVVGTNVHGAVVARARKRRRTGGHVAPSSMGVGDMVLFDTSRPHRAPPAPEFGCRRTLFMGWDTGKLQTQDVITYADFTRGYQKLKSNEK